MLYSIHTVMGALINLRYQINGFICWPSHFPVAKLRYWPVFFSINQLSSLSSELFERICYMLYSSCQRHWAVKLKIWRRTDCACMRAFIDHLWLCNLICLAGWCPLLIFLKHTDMGISDNKRRYSPPIYILWYDLTLDSAATVWPTSSYRLTSGTVVAY